MANPVKVKHSVNGKFYGMWYFFDSGVSVYLAHRKLREIYRKKSAWCIDTATLEEAKQKGVKFAGVVCRVGKDAHYYIAKVDDFFNSPYSFRHFGDTWQRGLPLSRFPINPASKPGYIASSMRLR